MLTSLLNMVGTLSLEDRAIFQTGFEKINQPEAISKPKKPKHTPIYPTRDSCFQEFKRQHNTKSQVKLA